MVFEFTDYKRCKSMVDNGPEVFFFSIEFAGVVGVGGVKYFISHDVEEDGMVGLSEFFSG